MRAAVGGLASILLLGGCGAGATAPPPAAAGVVEVPPVVVRVSQDIYGSRTERRAGEILSYRSVQDALEDCMELAGSTYLVPPFADIYASPGGFEPTTELSLWLRPLGSPLNVANMARLSKQIEAAQTSQPTPDPESTSDADSAPDVINLQRCTSDAFAALVPNIPPVVDEVGGGLRAITVAAESSATMAVLIAEYGTCMAGAGYEDVATPDELVVLVGMSTGSQTPEEVSDVEDAAVAADAVCRAPVLAHLGPAIAADLEVFSTTHEADVIAAREAWESYAQQASTYPEWTSVPPLP